MSSDDARLAEEVDEMRRGVAESADVLEGVNERLLTLDARVVDASARSDHAWWSGFFTGVVAALVAVALGVM